MPAKKIQRSPWLTEAEFKMNEGMRNELHEVINSASFKQAVHILTKRRQAIEATMEASGIPAPEITSVRLHSQRVGMEGFLSDLEDLCNVPREAPQGEPISKFNADVPDDFIPT
jgi:hypothetical protein